MQATRKDDKTTPEAVEKIKWWKLALTILALIGASFGLAYLFQSLASRLSLPLYEFGWLAYLTVFLTSLVSNLTIIAPVPFAISIMITAASIWNPVLVALAASVGGSLGELSAYYAGYLGRKVAIPESKLWHSRFAKWIDRWGPWAIFVLAFQPVLPFDVAGLIAGTARMPIRKFLPALWAGRFPKYLIFSLAGAQIIHHLPFLSL